MTTATTMQKEMSMNFKTSNMKATLDYFIDQAFFKTKDIEHTTEIDLFEQFEKLNNRLRYCYGSYYKFQDKQLELKYKEWLRSDDYKAKSFNLYYGNGIVD